MIIRYFILFFAFFSKTVGLSSVFNAEMNSACQNTLIAAFLWDLEKKAVFLLIFALTIVWRCGGYGPKKLINTISAEFGVFPSKNHDSIVFNAILLVTFRENHKKKKITIIRYFILFFAFFSKTVGLSSVFNAEMNSTCQNTLITAFWGGFGEKSSFSPNFCPYYSMAMWRLWDKKLINTISTEFGVFPSKNHDSIVFMQFC